ncbi:uncharacterized protein [Haliotis asinina]|uniref:uncharacterized protein n=1 Tax=Haliotis asinina TaxID=109174 RepID=UPI0035320501
MGRPRITESANKRRIQEEGKRRNQSRICLGVHFDRFNSLRENTGSSKSDVIKHLLDIHDQFCDCSNVQAKEDTDDREATWSISTSGTPPLPVTPGPDFSTPVCGHVDTPGTSRFDASVIASDYCNSLSPLAASLLHSPGVPDQAPCEMSQSSFSKGQREFVDENETGEDYDPNVSDTRATFGDNFEMSTVEEDLLNMPLPDDDDDDDVEEDETSEPLLDLISSPKYICYLDPIMDLVKQKAGDTCTRQDPWYSFSD